MGCLGEDRPCAFELYRQRTLDLQERVLKLEVRNKDLERRLDLAAEAFRELRREMRQSVDIVAKQTAAVMSAAVAEEAEL